MFVAILVWDHKRKEAKKMDCCICIGVTQTDEEQKKPRFSRAMTEEMFGKPKKVRN